MSSFSYEIEGKKSIAIPFSLFSLVSVVSSWQPHSHTKSLLNNAIKPPNNKKLTIKKIHFTLVYILNFFRGEISWREMSWLEISQQFNSPLYMAWRNGLPEGGGRERDRILWRNVQKSLSYRGPFISHVGEHSICVKN